MYVVWFVGKLEMYNNKTLPGGSFPQPLSAADTFEHRLNMLLSINHSPVNNSPQSTTTKIFPLFNALPRKPQHNNQRRNNGMDD